MSKYFDRLVQINESLDMELGNEPEMVSAKNNFEAAIKTYSKEGLSDGDCLIKAFNIYLYNNPNTQDKSIDDISLAGFCKWLTADPNDTELYLEEDEDNISIPKDSLTDDQKKDILKDNGVDAATVDGMKGSDELDSALDATLNNDELKMESEEEKVIRIDDDDLDVHGFVKSFDGEKVEFTDNENEAMTFIARDKMDKEINDICAKCNYDPETFSTVSLDGEIEDKWVSLDPIDRGATTLD